MKKHIFTLSWVPAGAVGAFAGGDEKDLMARMGFSKAEIAATKTKTVVLAETENESPVKVTDPLEESTRAAVEETAPVQRQINDDQFSDLRRRDWYEDLKQQQELKNHADFILYALSHLRKDEAKHYEGCTPAFFKKLAAERQAHRAHYAALSTIAVKIIATKDYEEYRKLKAVEDEILDRIETQKIEDRNDVMELKTSASELDAPLLEIAQRIYQ
jgi:hypothetical protein